MLCSMLQLESVPVAEWKSIGKHRVVIEGDVVYVQWRGELELDEVQSVFGLYGSVFAEHGRAFALVDLRQSGVPPEPVRRWIGEWQRSHGELSGAAAFGAGWVMRSLFLLVGRAMALIGRRQLPSAAFATEAEAREWINAMRQRLPHPSPREHGREAAP